MKYYIKAFKVLYKREIKPTWSNWFFRLLVPGLPRYDYRVWIKVYRPVPEGTLIRLDNGAVFIVKKVQSIIDQSVVYLLHAETITSIVDDLDNYNPELFHIWNPDKTEM